MSYEILIPITFFIAAAAVALPFARAYARRIEQGERGAQISSEVKQRLERMEQAIDSIAVEVERISDGRRFTTTLLPDAASSGAAPRDVPDA